MSKGVKLFFYISQVDVVKEVVLSLIPAFPKINSFRCEIELRDS